MTKAKVFWSGRSQAVRLPKEFRFEATEVLIYKEGDVVILKLPKKRSWPRGYWSSFDGLSDDFTLPEDLPPPPLNFDLDNG
jgi:antitoxin VapB